MNQSQLEKRTDMLSHSCITQEIPLKQIKGDTKWFVKRRDAALKAQASRKDPELAKLEQVQKGIINNIGSSNQKGRLNVGEIEEQPTLTINQIKDPKLFTEQLQKGIYQRGDCILQIGKLSENQLISLAQSEGLSQSQFAQLVHTHQQTSRIQDQFSDDSPEECEEDAAYNNANKTNGKKGAYKNKIFDDDDDCEGDDVSDVSDAEEDEDENSDIDVDEDADSPSSGEAYQSEGSSGHNTSSEAEAGDGKSEDDKYVNSDGNDSQTIEVDDQLKKQAQLLKEAQLLGEQMSKTNQEITSASNSIKQAAQDAQKQVTQENGEKSADDPSEEQKN